MIKDSLIALLEGLKDGDGKNWDAAVQSCIAIVRQHQLEQAHPETQTGNAVGAEIIEDDYASRYAANKCPIHALGNGSNEAERSTGAWFSDCPTCNPVNPLRQREISDVAGFISDMQRAWLNAFPEVLHCKPVISYAAMEGVYNYIRHYLRTTEPVLVEAAAAVIKDALLAGELCEYPEKKTTTIDAIALAKACAEVWRLKWK